MNIHIVNLEYLVSEQDVAKIRPSHRDFLDTGYSKGIFIASGPKSTKDGGIILAIGNLDEIKTFVKDDPFYIQNIAKYRFSSFEAVKHIDELGFISE